MPLEVLCLIAARAGSRGLRHKNVRLLAGVPLLVRAVALAKASARRGERWSVVVSTDSPRYARLAARAGAELPFLRPARLARDATRLAEVVLHAVRTLAASGRHFDAVVLLSPTTPLTAPADLRAALRIWREHGRQAVVSVTHERSAPSWRFELAGGVLRAPRGRRVGRRQDGGERVVLNGAVYVASPAWLERHGQFFGPGARALVMPESRSLDIESAHDLRLARLLVPAARGVASRKSGHGVLPSPDSRVRTR
jgi:CMP-N,N'-diacetyllegionaminic acid synthase